MSEQKPGHLFEALVSQTQLSVFIQIAPVLLVTGVHQAEDGETAGKREEKEDGEELWQEQ